MDQQPRTPGPDPVALAKRRAAVRYRNRILKRLVELYLTGTDLPAGMPTRRTIAEFHRLYRHIIAEGYGE